MKTRTILICTFFAAFVLAGSVTINDSFARGRGGGHRGGGGRRSSGGGRSGSVRHSNRSARPSSQRTTQHRARTITAHRPTTTRPTHSSTHYGSVRHSAHHSGTARSSYAGRAATAGTAAAAGYAAASRPRREAARQAEGPRGGEATAARAPSRGVARIESPHRRREATAVQRRDLGRVVDRLPDGQRRVEVRGHHYNRWGDSCYRRAYYNGRVRYVRIRPPIGWWVATLPYGYSFGIYGDDTYYYDEDEDVYYTESYQDGQDGYVVTEPPAEVAGEAEPAAEVAGAPDSFELLQQMSDYLGTAGQFSFAATDTIDDLSESGQKIQLTTQRTFRVARPDRVQGAAKGDDFDRKVFYDGKTIAIFDQDQKTYGVVDVPDTIDSMLDVAAEKYGITLPLADLLYSSVYDTVLSTPHTGRYISLSDIDSRSCHHLSFEGDLVDWQIWIDAGEEPLPRKMVITYKLAEGHPSYSATLKNWNLSPQLSPDLFEFTPPGDVERIEILPLNDEGSV